MRLALVSDLHGNELAFERVLADAGGAGYDQLVCLGDVATLGPRPREVLARLRGLGCACLLGNHDEFMLRPELVASYSSLPVLVASVHATRAALAAEDVDFIRGFTRTLVVDGAFLYHGTPRSNVEDLLATTPDARVDEMLAGHRATVYAGGHTHLQMVRQHRGALVVNSGSVGAPFREYASNGPPVILSHAEYAIVELGGGDDGRRVSVDLRRVELDRAALRAQVDGWDNPLAPSLRAMYT
jgi:predicted phosphodiesterase